MKPRTEGEIREEISRCQKAINKTQSKQLKYQYSKHIRRLEKDLLIYNNYKNGGQYGKRRSKSRVG